MEPIMYTAEMYTADQAIMWILIGVAVGFCMALLSIYFSGD